VGELAQLLVALRGVSERVGDEQLRASVVLAQRALRELQRDDGVHEPLLGAVVEVAHQPAPGVVSGRDQPSAGGGQLIAAVGVGDRAVEELGEARHALPGVAGRRLRARPVGRDGTHSAPSTTTGAPTTRRPLARTIAAIGPSAHVKSSFRAGRAVRRTVVERSARAGGAAIPVAAATGPTRDPRRR
jgi:hypothetical protein